MSQPEEKPDSLKFEEAMARLDAIVHEMESGQLPLEESLTRFEEGNKLAIYCGKRLDETEKRIEVLVKSAEGPQWKAMEEDQSVER